MDDSERVVLYSSVQLHVVHFNELEYNVIIYKAPVCSFLQAHASQKRSRGNSSVCLDGHHSE